MLAEFSLTCMFHCPPCAGKIFQFMVFILENALNLRIFTHAPVPNSKLQKRTKHAGLRIWNFEGYQRNRLWNFQGLIKNEVEFQRVTKKNKDSNTILWNFQGWSFVFSRISRGKIKKWKIPGGFQKSMSSTPSPPPHPLFVSLFLE